MHNFIHICIVQKEKKHKNLYHIALFRQSPCLLQLKIHTENFVQLYAYHHTFFDGTTTMHGIILIFCINMFLVILKIVNPLKIRNRKTLLKYFIQLQAEESNNEELYKKNLKKVRKKYEIEF